MTEGSPAKHILKFAMPLLVGNLFQQLYNMVDSIVVGNYVGSNALAAVGTCGSM
ncbi:MAG: oligosaccharide flippase family protein, partial [Lachnospiraceae bacterium]|nr:oligosaccharide flippase family protein [Lachnospiraceae bacterium]